MHKTYYSKKEEIHSYHHVDESCRVLRHSCPVEEAKSWTGGERHQGLHYETKADDKLSKCNEQQSFKASIWKEEAAVSLTLNRLFIITKKKQMQLQDDDRRHLQNFEKFREQLMIMKGNTSRESCARSCKVVRILRINDIASGEFQGLIYNIR